MRLKVAYGRVSTKQQADQGALERQERALLEATGADELILDVGSGKTTARPGYQRLLQLITDGTVEQLLVADQDRLNRNLQADLELWQLCEVNGTRITDLSGRQIEFTSPDGQLLSTVVSALNQHRSRAYGLKTQRALEQARKQGYPARPRVPFGLRKVRDEGGRFIAIDLDPITAPMARQRVEWFLAGDTLTGVCLRIQREQPDHPMLIPQFKAWLSSPMLTGRLCWHKDSKGVFGKVATEQTFPALISDAEHEAIKIKLAAASVRQGLRDRDPRMFTGLAKCNDCGRTLAYKLSGPSTLYLRCAQISCKRRNRMIRADQVFGVLQFSLSEHARALLPILQRPVVDPPEVAVLQREIEQLQGISGTESVVEAKRAEINRLRASDTETPGWLLVGLLRSPMFWLQSDKDLNRQLQQLLESVTVQLGESVADAEVVEVRCRTSPAVAPLPPDQRAILMPRGLGDLALAANHEQLVAGLLKELG